MTTFVANHIYIQDERGHQGYVYDDALGIFCLLDRYELESYFSSHPHASVSYEPVTATYQPFELPIGFNSILDLTTGRSRPRGPSDGAVFFLEVPSVNTSAVKIFQRLTPTPEVLRSFLYRSLIGQADNETLMLSGPTGNLFDYLDMLHPLTYRPSSTSFFYRPETSTKVLRELSTRKIVYGELTKETLRRPRNVHHIPFIVKTAAISWSHPDTVTPLHLHDVEPSYLSQGELLSWIIGR